MNLPRKQKQTHKENRPVVAKGQAAGVRDGWKLVLCRMDKQELMGTIVNIL